MRVSDLVKDVIFLVGSVECFSQVLYMPNISLILSIGMSVRYCIMSLYELQL